MENKDRKTIIAILIIVVLLLLAGVVYFLLFFKFPGAESPLIGKKNEPLAEEKIKPPVVKQEKQTVKQLEIKQNEEAQPAPQSEIDSFNLAKTAASFAERFGSYSNQSNFSNITDLKMFMTASMAKWADGYVAKSRQENKYADIYQGIMTKAISTEVEEFNEAAGTAKVLVKTQRVQATGMMNNSSAYYEDMTVIFAKTGGAWLVDSAKWLNKREQ